MRKFQYESQRLLNDFRNHWNSEDVCEKRLVSVFERIVVV